MTARFEVDDGHELNALLIALLEAKFHPNPERRELASSPLVARLCERAVAAYAAAQDAGKLVGGTGQKTRDFYRRPPPESVLAVVRMRIAESTATSAWREWDRRARQDYVRLLLSPFVAEEAFVDALLDAAGG